MRRPNDSWTKEQMARLRREAAVRETPELAADLGRTVRAVIEQCLKYEIPRRRMKVGRRPKLREVA